MKYPWYYNWHLYPHNGKVHFGILGVYILVAFCISFLALKPTQVQAASATWTNVGGDGKWSTCANWSGGTGAGGCPGVNDIATFNNTSIANCEIDTAINVSGISIAATYSGQITQDAGITMTIGSGNYSQAAGTFNGGNSAITINGTTGSFLSVSGGTFNAGSTTIDLNGTGGSSLLYIINTGTIFNANSSTINFNGAANYLFANGNPSPSSGTFNGGTSTVNVNSDSSPSNYAVYSKSSGTTFFNLNLTPILTNNRTYNITAGTSSSSIAINGDFTINPVSASAYRLTVNYSYGKWTVASSKTTTITGTDLALSTLNLTSSSLSYLSSGVVAIGSAGTFSVGSCKLILTGSAPFFTNSGTFTTTASSELGINSDSDVTLDMFGTRDIGNLIFSPILTADRIYNFDTSNTISIYGDFSVTPTAASALRLTVNLAYDISLDSANKKVTVQPAGSALATFDTTGSNYDLTAGALEVYTRGIFNANSSIITLNGTSISNLLYVSGSTATFNANSSTINLTGTASSSLLTVTSSGATFNANNSTINLTGTASKFLYVYNSGAIFNGNTSIVNINSDYSPDYIVRIIGTVTFNNLNLTPSLSADRTYPTYGPFTVNGDFNINPTASSAYRLAVNLGENVTVASSKTTTITGTDLALSTLNVTSYTFSTGILTTQSLGTLTGTTGTITLTGTNGNPFTNNGTFTAGSTTVNYSGNNLSGNTTIESNATYYKLGVTISAETYVLEGVTNVTNVLANSGPLNTTASGYAINAGGLLVSNTFTANGSIITLNGTSGTLFTNNGTFTANSSTVKMNSTASLTLNSGAGSFTFWNLTIDNVGQTGTLGAAITVNGNLAINNGTLADGGYVLTGNATNNLTMAAGTFLTVGIPSSGTSFPSGFTAPHISLNSASTVTYNSNSAQTVSGVPTYGNLILAATSAVTKNAVAPITAAGNLTIGANNTFSPANNAVNVAGDFINSGAFTPGATNTVTLNGTSAQSVTMAGQAFHNLTLANSHANGISFTDDFAASTLTATDANLKKLTFNPGSHYIITNLNIDGNNSSRIQLTSSGTYYFENLSGSIAVDSVNVNHNTAEESIDATNSIDSGNNTNWELLDHFSLDLPAVEYLNYPFNATLYAKDAGNNNTGAILGDTDILVDSGTITPISLTPANFVSGIWTGDLTLDTAGTRTITLNNDAHTGDDTLNITDIEVNITPLSANLNPGLTQQFTCLVTDTFGNPVALSPTWSIVNGGGTINSSGLFIAGNEIGIFLDTIKCTVLDRSALASIGIQALPAQDPTSTQNHTNVFADLSIQAPVKAEVNQKINFSLEGFKHLSNYSKILWDFGDEESASGVTVQHNYEAIGRFPVILTLKDQNNQSTTLLHTLDIIPPEPTITKIFTQGQSVIIKGKAHPKTSVIILIYSQPYYTQAQANTKGFWQAKIKFADMKLDLGKHKIVVYAQGTTADEVALKSEKNQYTLKLSNEDGKLKAEIDELKEQHRTLLWIIISVIIGFVLLLGFSAWLWRRFKYYPKK